jgi:hypothetical protein
MRLLLLLVAAVAAGASVSAAAIVGRDHKDRRPAVATSPSTRSPAVVNVGERVAFAGLDWTCIYKMYAGGRQVFCGRASRRAGLATVVHPHRVQVLEYGSDDAVTVRYRGLRAP